MASFNLSGFSKFTSARHFKVSCNNASDDHLKTEKSNLILPKTSLDMQHKNVDRRNLLLGVGGLYGAANVGFALADSITTPDDIFKCARPDNFGNPYKAKRELACCPPKLTDKPPKRYVLPEVSELRVRKPAHKVTPEYIEKYREGISLMKGLDDNDPHSWKNQAKIHCAYCNDVYNQGMTHHPELNLQIHGSSLFYPFHRWYLYFYEKILGKLLKDPTFALPYWNWDNRDGMMLPAMYADGDEKSNPLFDIYRQPEHIRPSITDLQYRGKDRVSDIVQDNLNSMKQQMRAVDDTNTFFGTDPCLGANSRSGSIEKGAHGSVHLWTGNHKLADWEDMGNFYSAGYDPIFYAHHSNIDRMWSIWKDMNPLHRDPTSQDWLNASFVFYDENKDLVRVYNQDCVNTKLMGYEFEGSEIPWENVRSTPRVKRRTFAAANPFKNEKKIEDMALPLKLDKIVKVLVKRPAINRTTEEKKNSKEMLFLNGIKFDGGKFVKFDVLVNDHDDGIETTASASEFAGTFIHVPHNHGHKMFMTTGTAFGITDLLMEIEADNDEYVLVTLVPWAGTEDATVSEIKIELVPIA